MRVLLLLIVAISTMIGVWFLHDRLVKSGSFATQVSTTATGQQWGLVKGLFEKSCDSPDYTKVRIMLLPDSIFDDAVEMVTLKTCPKTMRLSLVEDRAVWVFQSDGVVMACGPLYAQVQPTVEPCDRLYLEYAPIFACDHAETFRQALPTLLPRQPNPSICQQLEQMRGTEN